MSARALCVSPLSAIARLREPPAAPPLPQLGPGPAAGGPGRDLPPADPFALALPHAVLRWESWLEMRVSSK